VFAANHTELNDGYKTLETMKITTYVNARTTLEDIKLCHFFSLWCSDELSLIRYQLAGLQKLSNYKTSKIPKLKMILTKNVGGAK
jgi:hypothetical protein